MVPSTTSTSLPSHTATLVPQPDPAKDPATNLVDIHFGLLIVTHVIALLLTSTCVGLRLYVRRRIVRDIALDDWVLVAAQVSYVIYIAFMFGYGINIEVHGLQKVIWESFKIASLWEVPLVTTFVLVRAAIATFFLRVLPTMDNRITRIIIAATFWLYAVFMVTFLFLNVFQCGDPLKKRYGYYPKCLSGPLENNLPIIVRIVTMALDWLVTFLPILVIIKSTLSRQAKVSVIALMVLAGAGSTVSVLSIVFNDLGIYYDPESFGSFTIYSILSLLENGVAIIVLSVAALRPLFHKAFESKPKSRNRSSADQGVWFTPGSSLNKPLPGTPEEDDGVILLTHFKTEYEYSFPRRPDEARRG